MLLSIIVYTTTALILYLLAQHVAMRDNAYYIVKRKHLPMNCWELVLSYIVFCFIAGARYNVGVDHLAYLEEYLSMQNKGVLLKDTYEEGFVFITSVFAKIGFHYFFYFAFWGFLQIYFIYRACKNEKYILPYIALSIILGTYFLGWMNGVRQSVVACFFVYAVNYIEKKKLLPYIIGVAIAFTIHRSAVMLLPFFLLGLKPIVLKNRYVNYAIVASCIFLGSNPLWISATESVSGFLQIIGYDAYSENYSNLIDITNFRDTAWGPSRIGVLLSELIVIFYYPKIREYFSENRKIDIYFFLFFIGVCFYNLLINTSHIFLRPVEFLTIFSLPMSAFTLYYLKITNNTIWFTTLCVLLFTYIYIEVYKSIIMPSEVLETTLYKFFFFN